MFRKLYSNNFPGGRIMAQQHGDKFLVQNPPPAYETEAELDEIYSLPFERDAHPYYKKQGIIRALDTIRFSITSHRGCIGECRFCAVSMHQGSGLRSRSAESIRREARAIASCPD